MSWSVEEMDSVINRDDQGDEMPKSDKRPVTAALAAMVSSMPESDPVQVSGPPEGPLDGSSLNGFAGGEGSTPPRTVKGTDADKAYPDLSNLTTRKVPHRNLILSGVCLNCAHCGHKLSDSQSVLRGIGPVCSGKGYSEDFIEGDEIQAMIDLAEFPELVDFLTEHYKPLGIRGLVNGLVRVASLNRPRGRGWSEGNAKVHAACCDAIQSLGHKKMADLLRETLVIIEIEDLDDRKPGCVGVWVKKSDWTKWFSFGIRDIPGAYFDRGLKRNVVPVREANGRPKLTGRTRTLPDGRVVPESNKAALWSLLLREYGGAVARVKGKIVKVVEKTA